MTPANLSELTNIVCHSYVELIRKRELLAVTLKDTALRASYNKTKAGYGFLHIVHVLYSDLIIDTVSLLADQSSDTATLAKVIAELEKKTVHDHLRKEYVRPHVMNWLSKFGSESDRIDLERHMNKKETRKLAAEYRKLYNESLNNWERLNACAEFNKLRRIRNKILSHKATRVENGALRLFEFKDFKAKYGECEALIEAVEPILINVGSIVRKTDYGYKSAKIIYAKQAQEFWATCRGSAES